MKADMCFVEYVGGEKFEKETPKCSRNLEEFRRRSQPKSHEAKKTDPGDSAHDLFCMMLNVTLKNLRLLVQVIFFNGFDPMEIHSPFSKTVGDWICFFHLFQPTFYAKSKSWIPKKMVVVFLQAPEQLRKNTRSSWFFVSIFIYSVVVSQRFGWLNPAFLNLGLWDPWICLA